MLPCDRTDRLIGLPSALGLRAKRAPSDGISVVGACLTSPRPPISARRRQRWSVRNSPDVSSRYDACHSEVSLRAAAVRLLAIKETAAGSLRKQELFSCSFRPRANNRNFSASERRPAVLVSKAQLTVDVRLGGAGAAFTSGGGGGRKKWRHRVLRDAQTATSSAAADSVLTSLGFVRAAVGRIVPERAITLA